MFQTQPLTTEIAPSLPNTTSCDCDNPDQLARGQQQLLMLVAVDQHGLAASHAHPVVVPQRATLSSNSVESSTEGLTAPGCSRYTSQQTAECTPHHLPGYVAHAATSCTTAWHTFPLSVTDVWRRCNARMDEQQQAPSLVRVLCTTDTALQPSTLNIGCETPTAAGFAYTLPQLMHAGHSPRAHRTVGPPLEVAQ